MELRSYNSPNLNIAIQTYTKGERGITWKLSNFFFFLILCINPNFSCDLSSYGRMKRRLVSHTHIECTPKSCHISKTWQFLSLWNFHQTFYLFNYFYHFDYCQFLLADLHPLQDLLEHRSHRYWNNIFGKSKQCTSHPKASISPTYKFNIFICLYFQVLFSYVLSLVSSFSCFFKSPIFWITFIHILNLFALTVHRW